MIGLQHQYLGLYQDDYRVSRGFPGRYLRIWHWEDGLSRHLREACCWTLAERGLWALSFVEVSVRAVCSFNHFAAQSSAWFWRYWRPWFASKPLATQATASVSNLVRWGMGLEASLFLGKMAFEMRKIPVRSMCSSIKMQIRSNAFHLSRIFQRIPVLTSRHGSKLRRRLLRAVNQTSRPWPCALARQHLLPIYTYCIQVARGCWSNNVNESRSDSVPCC